MPTSIEPDGQKQHSDNDSPCEPQANVAAVQNGVQILDNSELKNVAVTAVSAELPEDSVFYIKSINETKGPLAKLPPSANLLAVPKDSNCLIDLHSVDRERSRLLEIILNLFKTLSNDVLNADMVRLLMRVALEEALKCYSLENNLNYFSELLESAASLKLPLYVYQNNFGVTYPIGQTSSRKIEQDAQDILKAKLQQPSREDHAKKILASLAASAARLGIHPCYKSTSDNRGKWCSSPRIDNMIQTL